MATYTTAELAAEIREAMRAGDISQAEGLLVILSRIDYGQAETVWGEIRADFEAERDRQHALIMEAIEHVRHISQPLLDRLANC